VSVTEQLARRLAALERLAEKHGAAKCPRCAEWVPTRAHLYAFPLAPAPVRCLACVREALRQMREDDCKLWDPLTGSKTRDHMLAFAELELRAPVIGRDLDLAIGSIEGDEGMRLKVAWTAARITVRTLHGG
jgi:hypothetical protein